MKTRDSLVSNSSSSSFIVVFPNKPLNDKEVFDKMFNGRDGKINSDYSDFTMTHSEISKKVFEDCKDNNEITLEELTDEFITQVHHELYDYEDNIKRGDRSALIKMLINFDCPNKALLTELSTLIVSNDELIKQESAERRKLMIKFGLINEFLSGKEPKEFQDADNELRREHWKKQQPGNERYYQIVNEIAKNRAEKYLRDHDGWWITRLTYEDHSPVGSFMEHQNVFRHIEHIRISHH